MRKTFRLGHTARSAARSLMDAGLSTRKVASIVGIAQSTAVAIKNDPDLSPELITDLKESIAGRFYKKSHLALNEITPDKLSKMNAYQNILIAKIGVDAARLAEGLPTQIVQTRSLAVKLRGEISDLHKRKQMLVARLGGNGIPSSPARAPSENVRRTVEE